MLKLGKIILDVPFFQAPLSGYSDYAMRRLAIDFGSPLSFAGVMLAKSAVNPKVLRKAQFRPDADEHPVGAQILGRKPDEMALAAVALSRVGFDVIDLNFACPAPKVIRRRRGGYLLNEPDLAVEILQRVREAVTCPVTIKLRIGFEQNEPGCDNFWEIAERSINAGADALVIHGRTVRQMFSGTADWQILAELKKRFPDAIIIGSGDMFDAKESFAMLKETGLDGLVIARGAIGNPWIFSQLRSLFEGQPSPELPGLQEQGRTVLRHFEMICGLYGPSKSVRFFRKFLVHYCRRRDERKKHQKVLLAAQNSDQLLKAIRDCYQLD